MQMDEYKGYAAKLLRVTAHMLDKAAVWPGKGLSIRSRQPVGSLPSPAVTHLMARCLDTHANHMRSRAVKSVTACE